MKKKKINKKKVITTTAFVVGGVCLAISAGVVLNRSKLGNDIKDYIATKMMESIVHNSNTTYINKLTVKTSYYLSNGYTEEQIDKVINEALDYFKTHLPLPKVG